MPEYCVNGAIPPHKETVYYVNGLNPQGNK